MINSSFMAEHIQLFLAFFNMAKYQTNSFDKNA